jgi:hypothetical protein
MKERDTYQLHEDVRELPTRLEEMTEQEVQTVLGVLTKLLQEIVTEHAS